jgi:hypothetical protein
MKSFLKALFYGALFGVFLVGLTCIFSHGQNVFPEKDIAIYDHHNEAAPTVGRSMQQFCLRGPFTISGATSQYDGNLVMVSTPDGEICWTFPGHRYWIVDLGSGLIAVNEYGEWVELMTVPVSKVREFKNGVR